MANTKTTATILSPQQLRLLTLLFKFRFVTTPLLAPILHLKTISTYERLERLLATGLVTKHYEKTYRLHGQAARYSLSKTGVTTVRRLLALSEPEVHALYKNDQASEAFMQHNLAVLGTYPALQAQLPTGTQLFTRTELGRFDELPSNRPDLYLRTADGSKEYFVLLVHDLPPYLARKRLTELLRHYDEEGGDSGPYPTLLFVLSDDIQAGRFRRFAASKLESEGFAEEELTIAVASLETLCRQPYEPAVWTIAGESQARSLI